MKIEELSAYEILEDRHSDDLDSRAVRLRHRKTGARIVLLSNHDNNKVFYIGFRTPPTDSTGVAHITEHSVLCGSKNFPLKDPFVELVKGSLNTFLNAMTYPDKTVYPVASCNDQDFQNLMHVYLDAVFYPNTYTNESIFRQEGWHYELDENGDLMINGVVYNEMKGALSSPDDLLEREIMTALYPDTTYAVESGGDPDFIPDLTYEAFLDFHRRYYHPANSYIYLYGDMDMAEKLDFIDREYLSSFDACTIDSSLSVQGPFECRNDVVKTCSINEGDSEEDNTFLSLNFSVADNLDPNMYIAFQILDYALCSAAGAPLKQTLVDKGLGVDVYSSYEGGVRQPYFSIVAKGTTADKKQEFIDTVYEELKRLAKEGFDKKFLLAGINHMEFQYREADFGSYPKGLMYGLQALDSWLFDDTKPFVYIEANEIYSFLKEAAKGDYFERLMEKYLICNPHSACVTLVPEVGLSERKEKKLAEELARKKAGLSDAQLDEIKAAFEALKEFQEREDSAEELACLPLLKRSDLKRAIEPLTNEVIKVGETTLLHHDVNTNGIGYLRLVFCADDLPGEYYPYIGMLKQIIGLVDTKKHSYADLNNEVNLVTGGVSVTGSATVIGDDSDHFTYSFVLKTKYLLGNEEPVFELLQEILLDTLYDNKKRLEEILGEVKSQMQGAMISAGHQTAVARALTCMSTVGRVLDEVGGLSFYRLVSDILDHFEERGDEVVAKLQETVRMLFRPENLMVDLTSTSAGLVSVKNFIPALKSGLYTDTVRKELYRPEPLSGNEAFTTGGSVLYVCRAGNYKAAGLEYTGALRVLRVMMGYQYLWVNVRVKGGAYGCMSSFGRDGYCHFVSYRDPNLSRTIDVYEGAAASVASFEADERTMTQLIIGTVSELDTPLTPSARGTRSFNAYVKGITEEDLQRERDQVLDATPEDIRALSAYISAFMDKKELVVVGNAAKINEEAELFDRVTNLL